MYALLGIPRVQMLGDNRLNETIDYNERLSWDNHGWLQGRAGFGPTGMENWRGFQFKFICFAEHENILEYVNAVQGYQRVNKKQQY